MRNKIHTFMVKLYHYFFFFVLKGAFWVDVLPLLTSSDDYSNIKTVKFPKEFNYKRANRKAKQQSKITFRRSLHFFFLDLPRARNIIMLLSKARPPVFRMQTGISKGNNLEFMGHEVFTGSVVFVRRVQA